MTSARLVPMLLAPFIVWRIYVRVRRNIGRQPFQPGRLVFRIVIFALVTGLIGYAARGFPASEAWLGGGLFCGVLLAWGGLHLTRFEFTEAEKFYTPNTVIGLTVTLLLVGRLVYRMSALLGGSSMTGHPVPALFQSPVTLLMFGVTAGYYIAYFTGVLLRGKQLTPAK